MHLDLVEFPTFEPIHIVAPIGATFLRQRAAQLRASSKRPRVEPFGVAPPPLSCTGATTIEEPVDHAVDVAATDVPSPLTSDDSDVRRMLETVITVQAAHRQILVDMFDELRALRADLEHLRRLPLPPPFNDL